MSLPNFQLLMHFVVNVWELWNQSIKKPNKWLLALKHFVHIPCSWQQWDCCVQKICIKVCTKFKRHILSGWISISHQRPRRGVWEHVYNMRNLVSLQCCSKEKPGLTLIIVGILSKIFQSVFDGSTQCCCPEDTAFQHLHFSSCYRVRALFSSTLPSVPLQTFIQASVLPQVHTGDNWRVVETVRRHRCPLWPYQQHSAGVRQPSGQFEVTSVISNSGFPSEPRFYIGPTVVAQLDANSCIHTKGNQMSCSNMNVFKAKHFPY